MNFMMLNPKEVAVKTEKMYQEVLSKHTTFHRMEHFISFLNTLNDK